VTIDGVDPFGVDSIVVVWIDKLARAAVMLLGGGELDRGGGLGVLKSTLVRFPIVGLGLLLAKLPMGLVNPLLLLPLPTPTEAIIPAEKEEDAEAGATTPILSSSSVDGDEARMVAALSSTEGTF
jgi:hypothetical protein